MFIEVAPEYLDLRQLGSRATYKCQLGRQRPSQTEVEPALSPIERAIRAGVGRVLFRVGQRVALLGENLLRQSGRRFVFRQ
jgi:hypothetical protein